MKEFKLPDLGEGVHEGKIVRVLVKPGDQVKEDQPLMEVETDKAAVEIPSPHTGEVQSVHVKAGQLVNVGDVMFTFGEKKKKDQHGHRQKTASATAERQKTKQVAASPTATSPKGNGTGTATLAPPKSDRRKPASPAVRKLARELGVEIETIEGTGPGGRILRDDVQRASKKSPVPSKERVKTNERETTATSTHPPAPSLQGRGSVAPPKPVVVEIPIGRDETDQYGPTRRVEISQARKTIGSVMAQSWSTIPHATDHDDADVTELDKLRKGYASPETGGRKLTMLAFVIRAVVRALQRFPTFNASIDLEREEIIYRRYINIAIGVHSERGLVPMVIRETDKLSIPQISDALAGISEKARAASFAVNDTRGGTYTLSNAGAMGGCRYSTPIITPPQVAVLALGRTKWMPWVVDGEIVPRLILPLSHSFDHRILDGGDEIAFMQHVIADLQNPARLLL